MSESSELELKFGLFAFFFLCKTVRPNFSQLKKSNKGKIDGVHFIYAHFRAFAPCGLVPLCDGGVTAVLHHNFLAHFTAPSSHKKL